MQILISLHIRFRVRQQSFVRIVLETEMNNLQEENETKLVWRVNELLRQPAECKSGRKAQFEILIGINV